MPTGVSDEWRDVSRIVRIEAILPGVFWSDACAVNDVSTRRLHPMPTGVSDQWRDALRIFRIEGGFPGIFLE